MARRDEWAYRDIRTMSTANSPMHRRPNANEVLIHDINALGTTNGGG
jgi:hypothetical protein